MKSLIQKIFIFLLPILLVFILIEGFYRVIPNDFSVKNKLITQKYQNTEILILGNSHSFYGLNPAFFDNPAFNLANVSQTLYFDKLLFEKHIDKFKNLKFVILNIEYTSLSQLKDTQEDVWRKYYYERYMDLEVPIISALDPQSYFLSSTRDFSNNLKLIQRYFKNGTLVDCDSNGFGNNYIKENRNLNLEEIAKVTVKKHEDNLWDFTENVTLVQSIIDICKKKGINVIIVTMPVSKEYPKKS